MLCVIKKKCWFDGVRECAICGEGKDVRERENFSETKAAHNIN